MTITNIVDKSGLIIMSKSDLIDLIQILTGTNNVQITSEAIAEGCLMKVKIFEKILRITVDCRDFHICHNDIYNFIRDHFISLDRCII